MAANTRETFKERTGTAGAAGHIMKINLLTLLKLRGDHQLKDFTLAGNSKSAGGFDDIAICYTDASDKQNAIFLLPNCKENEKYEVTIETFQTGKEWPIQKYFSKFLRVMDKFKSCPNDHPIFGGNTDNLNCDFVIYTNANSDDDAMKEKATGTTNPLHFVLGETHGQAYRLKADTVNGLMQGVQHELEIEQVMKLLTKIPTAKCKNLRRDCNFKRYHSFFIHVVFAKHGSYWKFRDDFLNGKTQNETLKKFRERTFRWYAKEIMHDKKYTAKEMSSDESIISHMRNYQLELPPWFQNTILNFEKNTWDQFIKIVLQCISDNVCTITKMNKKLLKEVSKFVGNVFVFDEDKIMFKLNDDKVLGEPRVVLEYLTFQLNNNSIDPKLYFDFQIEKFPKLSLGFTHTESKKIQQFADQLTILTNQPNVDGLKNIIQQNIYEQSSENALSVGLINVRYLQMTDKIQAWQKQEEKTKYLKKDDGFLDEILSGFTLIFGKDPMKSTGRTEFGKTALGSPKVLPGNENEGKLSAQFQEALTLSKQEKHVEALSSYQEILDQKIQVLGPNHQSTITTQNDIALALYQQDKYEEALSLYQEVLEKRTQSLGPNHTFTLITDNNIAIALFKQGQYDKALCNLNEVLKKMTKVLGPNHPETLTAQNNIALALSQKGQYNEALHIYTDIIEKRNNILGHDHPSTLTTCHDIALTLYRQGKYEEALSSYQEVLAKRTKILGPNHPCTLITENNIALTLFKQGQYEAAISSYEEVLDKMTKALGPNHQETLTAQNNIALAFSQKGQYEKALGLYTDIIEKRNTILGPDHPTTLTTKNNIALTLCQQGKYEEALSVYQEVLAKRTKILGPSHPSTLITENNIALTLLEQGQYEKAISSFNKVMEKMTKVLGPNHPDTLKVRNNIALAMKQQGQHVKHKDFQNNLLWCIIT